MQHRLAPEVLVFAAEADHPEWAQATVHALDDGDGGRAELLAHDREHRYLRSDLDESADAVGPAALRRGREAILTAVRAALDSARS